MHNTEQHHERRKIIASFILPVIFVAFLWAITVFDQVLNLQLWRYGILPHTVQGLVGILFYPLIHSGFGHIASNSLPLLILGALTMYFYRPLAIRLFIILYFAGGIITWLIARPGAHVVGASGIIYGLSGFLIFSGIIRKNRNLLAISLLVIFVYSGIIAGMFPFLVPENVSWEGHLSGFFVGMTCAFIYRKQGPPDEQEITLEDDDIDYTMPMYGDDEDMWETPGYYEGEDD